MPRYFAKIENNIVVECRILDANEKWEVLNLKGKWVETFMDTPGHNYAGIGYTYIPASKNFAPPQPFPSWTLDKDCQWQPPTPKPDVGEEYFCVWNENLKYWDVMDEFGIKVELNKIKIQ